MEKVAFGTSGMKVTRMCVGTWNMAAGEGWGPESENAAIALIRRALDGGCNFVDTARVYGDGKSEEIVGRAVKGRREQVIIASKMMHGAPGEVAPTLEESLKCLGTDYIDLYICHWPRPSLPFEPFFEEMARQREAGKIRAVGVSNFDLAQMRVAAEYGAVSLQPPFSILWRIPDELLAFCREQSIAVTPYSPLAQGLLTGRYSRAKAEVTGGPRRHNVLFSEKVFPSALAVAEQVDAVADRMKCTSSQVALAWALRTPGITSVIVGASSPEQWDQNVGALQLKLTDDDYRQLSEAGLQVWSRLGPEATMWGWKPT